MKQTNEDKLILLCIMIVEATVCMVSFNMGKANAMKSETAFQELPTVKEQMLRTANKELQQQTIDLKQQLDILQQQIDAEKEEQLNRRWVCLTDRERELVCRIVAAEARGETYEGQLGVAQVIRDRYLNGHYGKTITDVVMTPYQFAYPYEGDLDAYPTVAVAVQQVFDNNFCIFDGAAIHFFNPKTSNQEAVTTIRKGSCYFGIVGRHEFRGIK